MAKGKKTQPPRIVAHRPVVQQRVIYQWPPCEADLVSPEAIEYRLRQVSPHHRAAAQRVDGIQCGNFSSYTIDGHWYCKKHAGAIALEMLAVPVEETE
jgi:hypothetical protein